jgi:hypothetical protein
MAEKSKLETLAERVDEMENAERAAQTQPLDIAQLIATLALTDPAIKRCVSSDTVNEAAVALVNSLRSQVSSAITAEMIDRSRAA